ncbi:hypothetical protein ASPWEDRAFT_48919 [Aspergillus wentii DTO 134E9]|uniref:Heterokaryon incompatibility domain-containing protein n=1 Tax=Aspergillus wentii DTO 134E9 TaxID=1073089 RepID=A0A1L9RV56_ASPWE|nr:uncharacterized protein ASPWEDRAFT_48919 [Aspergillus wentii DTO 134E9]OJJ38764.1 hypothetical protein ASPWEDRAFT_48919 [Aspergillus wentii DTO 134E9]
MKLLNTTTLQLEQFPRRNNDGTVTPVPKYAILSHTWGPSEQEVSAQRQRPDTAKIAAFCQKAREARIDYAWVDTCCINKTDPVELNHALNSMFLWYRESVVCCTYISDVRNSGDAGFAALHHSRWFTRGWTLQELLAPLHMVFFNSHWDEIGTKASLQRIISQVTGIPSGVVLFNDPTASVAQRMSWASGRQTSRLEDRAYSLMGLFGVHMPMIYGEGEMAFQRLQLEIMKVSSDQTLFARTTRNPELRRRIEDARPLTSDEKKSARANPTHRR